MEHEMKDGENEPVRRNLLVVSTVFLLYFLAGGSLDHKISTGLVWLEVKRMWVVDLAAWGWFGYAWLRYRLIYGTRAEQFHYLLGGDRGLHTLLNETLDKYKQSQHFNIVKTRIFKDMAHEHCEYSVGLPNHYFPCSNSKEEKEDDALTGRKVLTSKTLFGGWVIKFSASNGSKSGKARADGITKVSFLDAPAWRLQILRQLFVEHHQFTERYLPAVYAQVAFVISAVFGLTALVQEVRCWMS